mgnify:CR=1 FL=1
MSLKPLNSNLIVKPIQEEEKTSSGIVLPESSKNDKPQQGEVKAVGPGKLLDNGNRAQMSVKEGDKIIFKSYSPDELNHEGEDYLVLNEDDILAIVE